MWELKPSGRIIALLHRPPLCPFDTGWDFMQVEYALGLLLFFWSPGIWGVDRGAWQAIVHGLQRVGHD